MTKAVIAYWIRDRHEEFLGDIQLKYELQASRECPSRLSSIFMQLKKFVIKIKEVKIWVLNKITIYLHMK